MQYYGYYGMRMKMTIRGCHLWLWWWKDIDGGDDHDISVKKCHDNVYGKWVPG